jgi:hypothetical protein
MAHKRRMRQGFGAHCAFIACLTLTCLPAAHAFNAAGHMVIGLIAYDQLDAETRQAAVALLEDHPRFDQQFIGKMPQNVWGGSDAEKDQWIFAHAGTWPDIVRSRSSVVTAADVRDFNRPTWHYVNFPVFLNAEEGTRLGPGIQLNRDTQPPEGRDDPSMNVMQAFQNSCRIVADPKASRRDRAVHLCWVLHLGQDSHQPLHGAALFTSQRFPTGDRGGNDIQVRGSLKLHSLWDRAILDTPRYNDIRRASVEINGNETLAEAGRRAGEELSVTQWIEESHALAESNVYTASVRRYVAEAETRDSLGAINPPAAYYRRANEVCRRRAVEAGFRLAATIAGLLNGEAPKDAPAP